MYSERDMADIRRRIRAGWLAMAAVAGVLLAVYAAGLALRVQGLVTASGVLLFAAMTFGFTYFMQPKLRYRRFLAEMGQGLIREQAGIVLAVSDIPELQDGARVRLRLFGRHITDVMEG